MTTENLNSSGRGHHSGVKAFVACDEIVLISGARRKQIFVSHMLVLPRIKPEVLRDFVFSPDTPAGDGSGIQEDS